MVEKVRAIRGATQLSEDSVSEIESMTVELMSQVMEQNQLTADDLISVLFTATPDIHANFPAAAARAMGLGQVPLLCATEIDVPGALPLVIRVMAHAYTELPASEIKHVYLHGAKALRKDIAQ
jgi:chorismate mutase